MFGACASSRFPARGRHLAMALGLFTESALAVHLADGVVVAHFHYFVMLAVLALYEDFAVLAAGVGYVVLQHGAMGQMAPQYVFGQDIGAGHPWLMAVVHDLFVLAAAAALVANWRAHALVRVSERAIAARPSATWRSRASCTCCSTARGTSRSPTR